MNLLRMQSSLASLFEAWLEERGKIHLAGRSPENKVEHDQEWVRFKFAVDQALRTMDGNLRD